MNVVFFDGYCSLCNHFVDWLMRTDKSGKLKFASLQGETATQLIGKKSQVEIDTVVYLRGAEQFERSSAVIQILKDIGGLWSILQIFIIVPPFIRDFLYRFVAKNRYRIFGKRDTCRLPSMAERERLLP